MVDTSTHHKHGQLQHAESALDSPGVTASQRKKNLLGGLIAGFLASLIWGIWPVVSRLGVLTNLNPYDIVFIRFLVSGLLLTPAIIHYGLRGISVNGAALLAIGAGMPYVLITVIGLQFTNASHGGLVVPSFNIIFSTLGVAVFLGIKPDRARLTGITLILTGCGAIFLQSLNGVSASTLLGDIIFVAGGFTYAIYTVTSQKYGIPPLQAVSIVSVFSAIAFVPFYLAYMPSNLLQATPDEIALQIVFQGVITSIVAIYLFSRAINVLGASRAVVFLALMPVSSMFLAIPVLGEWPTWVEWMSLPVIVSGIVIALNVFEARPAPA
ncbi:MAG: DMT family transporter [Proteobacteria bacterium]|nr:DMT family transporter [Pseudomonadota bacterium]